MPIENVWPGKKATGMLRAMYNIAVRRMNPGHAPKRDQEVMEANIDGRRTWVRLYGSANQGYHWIRFTPSVAETLRNAAQDNPEEPVIFLALWRDPNADDKIIHTWRVPSGVVDQMDAQLPAGIEDKRRNLTIQQSKTDGRWYWAGSRALQRIDLTNYYAPWNLDNDEVAHIRNLASAPEATAQPSGKDDLAVEEMETTLTIERAIGINKIYFGPPGTGKTWSAHALCDSHPNPKKFPTTFHPEYTYFDFVGSYKPVMAYSGTDTTYRLAGGESLPVGTPAVVYRFVAGVFVSALLWTLNHPKDNVFLIIDEINRGNCAAIFGDIFQLLDRVVEPGPEQGRSRYAIHLDPVMLEYCCSNVSPKVTEELRESGLRLPKNMHFLATMNTSDQSLFPMDSAFKRRWEWEYVPINYDQEDIQCRSAVIRAGAEGQTVPWVKFLRHVNQRIAQITGSDDKQIGVYFVPLDGDVLTARFLNKILFYLWTDVFRHNAEALFAPGIQSYDDLARRFLGGEWVFKPDFVLALGIAANSAGMGGQP